MQQTCRVTGEPFEITTDDLRFYDSVSPVFNGKKYLVPPPTLCPKERERRRLASINVRNLYKRTCDATGKSIISIYAPAGPMTVYDVKYWWSDAWSPLKYGREFDFSRTFFEQMKELIFAVPIMALVVDDNENSEYVHYCGWDKNCYLCFCVDHSEDCLYCQDLYYSRNAVDCLNSYNLELCYECVDCNNCYDLKHSQNCTESNSSWYLYDCHGCSDCFGCVGLRRQQYCIFNEQYSPEEYANTVVALRNDPSSITRWNTLKEKFPRKNFIGLHNENSSGNYLFHCKNAQECFDCNEMEDAKYCTNMKGGGKNCQDIHRWGHPVNFCYDCCGIGEGSTNVCFSTCCWMNLRDIYYCHMCTACQDCFGCSGLRHKQYCIFNRQYSKEEYEQLVPKIIAHMQQTGEWGEFFPIEISPFAYNETFAQEYFPLSKEEVRERGWQWREPQPFDTSKITKKVPAAMLPKNIQEIPDDILHWALECSVSGRLFTLQKSELNFYRRMNLPIPHFHPDERHKCRVAQRNPRTLWQRKCAHCAREIETTYSPERPEPVYCEQCYVQTVA